MTHDSKLLFNQSAEEYHSQAGASASRLNKLNRSPAHLKHSLDHPDEPTRAMIIGSAVHSAVLEPELFSGEWGRIPEGHGASKAVKEAKAELAEQFAPDQILKASDYDMIITMRDSVLGNPVAASLLEASNAEVSSYWTDPKTGIPCKARIDAMPFADSEWGSCLVDVKTTVNASPKEFQRSVFNFGYMRQASHYLSATQHMETGEQTHRNRFIFICVEKSPPYCTAMYELDPDALALGKADVERLLGVWADCESSDEWPSYPTEVQELSLPAWAYTR